MKEIKRLDFFLYQKIIKINKVMESIEDGYT